MSYNRFILLKRFIHLNTSDAPARDQPDFDPWHKLRPLLDHFSRVTKHYYVPERTISIDESMVGMKNRHVYIQYVSNKRHCRFGMKKFELCESSSGYVYHLEIYSGKDFTIRGDDGQGSAVVLHLLEESNLLQKGYHLLTDNFYTKVSLAKQLWDKDTLLTGTIRATSRGFPDKSFPARMPIQSTHYLKSDQVLACAYRDKKTQKKPVMLLSTASTATDYVFEKRGERRLKPLLVLAYNRGMGGVDLSDRKLYQIAAERTTNRYWLKIFFNIIDICLRNSYHLYTKANPNSTLTCHDFCANVVETLCANNRPIERAPAPDLTHCLTTLPGRKEKDCIICSDRTVGLRHRSRTWCPGCKAGVHKRCFAQLNHNIRVQEESDEEQE